MFITSPTVVRRMILADLFPVNMQAERLSAQVYPGTHMARSAPLEGFRPGFNGNSFKLRKMHQQQSPGPRFQALMMAKHNLQF